MLKLRQTFSAILLFSLAVMPCAVAQTTLTQIQDTVYNTDGSLFNGTLVVTWTGTPGTGAGPSTPSNASVRIYNGALSITLAPTTTSPGNAPYTAVFTSSNGLTTWTQTWQVPQATTPLTLSQINLSTSTSSGMQVAISQVVGLNSFLNAVNGSLSSLTSTVNGINATVTGLSTAVMNLTSQVNSLSAGSTNSGITINTVFVDAEVPAGSINGTNTNFTLANTPVSSSAADIYLNGLLLALGTDYTLNGSNISFINSVVPQSGDTMEAYYRMPGTSNYPGFVDDAVPSGTINGTNLAFALASAPSPLLSLRLYKNGNLLQQNVDYMVNGATITFASTSVAPQAGDSLSASYRH